MEFGNVVHFFYNFIELFIDSSMSHFERVNMKRSQNNFRREMLFVAYIRSDGHLPLSDPIGMKGK